MNKMNKKQKIEKDYKQLQHSLFLKTAVWLTVAILGIVLLYNYVFRGHFSTIIVRWLYQYVYSNYDDAYNAYNTVIRVNRNLYVLITILVAFLIILRSYFKSFAKYFYEINMGIDALADENGEDVVLSPELSSTEKKINAIKDTLAKRKTAAEQAEQRKKELVVYLAHDLKTPLTSVIGYLTLLRDEQQISEELREKYLSISLEKAERLEDLINEFFEITRFNLSNITLEYRRVNLTRLLEQLTYEFKPMFIEKNLECILEAVPDVSIRCDVDKMQRVFDNLLRNAVNYSFENGIIHITVSQDEKSMRLLFSNQGNTIPKEKLGRIFEQFYRLDSSRSTKSGGAGLGLAIAKEIVELHGGEIKARSENEVIEFEVILPFSLENC